MSCAKPVYTPLAPYFALSAKQCPSSLDECPDISMIPYACVVGCLMYAMVCTRPDLVHTVGIVSSYM